MLCLHAGKSAHFNLTHNEINNKYLAAIWLQLVSVTSCEAQKCGV